MRSRRPLKVLAYSLGARAGRHGCSQAVTASAGTWAEAARPARLTVNSAPQDGGKGTGLKLVLFQGGRQRPSRRSGCSRDARMPGGTARRLACSAKQRSSQGARACLRRSGQGAAAWGAGVVISASQELGQQVWLPMPLASWRAASPPQPHRALASAPPLQQLSSPGPAPADAGCGCAAAPGTLHRRLGGRGARRWRLPCPARPSARAWSSRSATESEIADPGRHTAPRPRPGRR